MSEFNASRRRALARDLLARLAGEPVDLLPFEEVREGLRLRHLVDRGRREVPLDSIVGSVGRAHEFNRFFLPRQEASRDRWQRIEQLAEGPVGFAPINLYPVGGSFFVVDGHHRVSVARALGAPAIEAWVQEFVTPPTLAPGESPDEALIERGRADFLEATGLSPEATDELRVTVASGYARLLEHISVHRYYRGIETGRPVGWPEAIDSWRRRVYRRVVDALESSGVLELFPRRTAADLYLWLVDHLHRLRGLYAREEEPADAG